MWFHMISCGCVGCRTNTLLLARNHNVTMLPWFSAPMFPWVHVLRAHNADMPRLPHAWLFARLPDFIPQCWRLSYIKLPRSKKMVYVVRAVRLWRSITSRTRVRQCTALSPAWIMSRTPLICPTGGAAYGGRIPPGRMFLRNFQKQLPQQNLRSRLSCRDWHFLSFACVICNYFRLYHCDHGASLITFVFMVFQTENLVK